MPQIATSVYRYNTETGQVEFNLELTNGIPEADRDFVGEVSVEVIDAVENFVNESLKNAGAGAATRFFISKPIFAIGFTLESLLELKAERDTHGEQS